MWGLVFDISSVLELASFLHPVVLGLHDLLLE